MRFWRQKDSEDLHRVEVLPRRNIWPTIVNGPIATEGLVLDSTGVKLFRLSLWLVHWASLSQAEYADTGGENGEGNHDCGDKYCLMIIYRSPASNKEVNKFAKDGMEENIEVE
jgi:hypothetical protein